MATVKPVGVETQLIKKFENLTYREVTPIEEVISQLFTLLAFLRHDLKNFDKFHSRRFQELKDQKVAENGKISKFPLITGVAKTFMYGFAARGVLNESSLKSFESAVKGIEVPEHAYNQWDQISRNTKQHEITSLQKQEEVHRSTSAEESQLVKSILQSIDEQLRQHHSAFNQMT